MANEAKKEKFVMLEMTTDMNYTELAKELDVTERTLYNWRRDPEFQKMKEKMVREAFSDMASKAFKSLFDLSQQANSEMVRYQASADLLDRAGHKPTDKQDLNITVPQFIEDVPEND